MLIDRSRSVLTAKEAAAYLGVSTDMLQRWRTKGCTSLGTPGPAYIPWGLKTVRYVIADLDAWLEAQPRAQNTIEAAHMLRAC